MTDERGADRMALALRACVRAIEELDALPFTGDIEAL